MALVGGHRRDAEQRPAGRGAGCELGGVDARLGDVHPVARQRVQVQQPAPSPGAGCDDGSGDREHRAFPHPDIVGHAVCRPMAQRHVDEHDQAQPARLRHHHLGGRRGDQPVEQNDGVVGDPPDDAIEGGERRRVGRRPGAGYGVLVHQPADRGEPAAEMAVVGVASARPGRVVDAIGYNEMHLRHSDRS